jgi:preprotein translocase subunit YajC
MQLNSLPIILAQTTTPTQTPTQTPPGAQGFFGSPLIMMGLMVVVFYFILIRPQQKRAKEQRKMLEALKSGDKVVTSAGIIGEVITVKDRTVSLRSADTKLEVTKDSVVAITEPKA